MLHSYVQSANFIYLLIVNCILNFTGKLKKKEEKQEDVNKR